MQTQSNGVSVIIPTFQEAKNINALIMRITQVDMGRRAFEVILVDDDSQDGITEIVDALRTQYPWLKLIVRMGQKNLSTAVIDGFKTATYPFLILMDADLSHPPEKIPQMLAYLENLGVDMVIGSRYAEGGSTEESWPRSRQMISKIAATVARWLIAVPAHDPLSGFLAIRKDTFLSGDALNPIGWKIGLEIIIKCHCNNIKEIPIHFSRRYQGYSKLNFKVIFDYLRHINRLFLYKVFIDSKSR